MQAEKNEKDFLIFQKIAGFSNRGFRKSLKILVKKEVSGKLLSGMKEQNWGYSPMYLSQF